MARTARANACWCVVKLEEASKTAAAGSPAACGGCDGQVVIPWEPYCGILFRGCGVPLESHEVIEWVDLIKGAGVNHIKSA